MDKFPLPPREDLRGDSIHEGIYSYLGLRDRSGRASATAVALYALEALVEATESTQQRRRRIAQVFKFLGYAPRVEHTYRWRYSSILRSERGLRDLLDEEEGAVAARSVSVRLQRMVDRDESILDELQTIVDNLRSSHPTREVRLTADFRSVGTTELDRFRDMQLLKRAGLVELSAVELEREDGGLKVDLREVSSGELSLVTAFLGLAAVIENDALVLIDEPEVSLHPEWQSQYLGLLTKVFSSYSGCHFVVATHSPLVVSDVSPDAANVASFDPKRQVAEPGADYAGDSVDEVLVRAFDVPGNNNLYLKQRLVEALRLAADGAAASPEFRAAMEPLLEIAPRLDPGSPTLGLIEQLRKARERSAD
ncbi:AAA family ATPase [Microbacter sp. GSS18]|nr:AAA family ATPase [Microbacter sp. GSS18]